MTRAGLFVELNETGADGLIPARHIGEEYFRFEEAARAFVGRSAKYRLGDPVTVEHDRVFIECTGNAVMCRRQRSRATALARDPRFRRVLYAVRRRG